MMSGEKPKAIVLLSGGIDSTTALAVERREGYAVHAISFQYGQRQLHDREAAARDAQYFDLIQHITFDVNIGQFGGSALTADIGVPKDRAMADMEKDIPVTYVPARNTVFLSIALAWAEVLGAGHIFLGVNAIDYSGYPDCRPEFIALFETLANIGTKAGVEGARFRIHAPLLALSKAAIIRKARELDVDLALTHSCYDPSPQGLACGLCDACQLRLKGFREAGLTDPIHYVS